MNRDPAGGSPPRWQRDALAARFHLDAITFVAEFVAGGVASVDGPPIEVLPGYWVIPGFLPYDGPVILAALDRRPVEALGMRLRLGVHDGAPFGNGLRVS